jgi:hypothetical protein
MCYNLRAVESTSKERQELAIPEPAQVVVQNPGPSTFGSTSLAGHRDVSRYCPLCSRQLEPRRCKLVCSVCGYYMSCADYY